MAEITFHTLTDENAGMLRNAAVFDNPVKPAQLAAFLADPGHVMVFACAGAQVAGFASGTVLLHPDKAPMMFINEVGVEPGLRRRGIARDLCRRLMDEGRAMGCDGFWLATEVDNIAARALYRSLTAQETTGVVVYDWGGVMS